MKILLLIPVSQQNFRTAVFHGSTECSEQFPGHHVCGCTKVNQLDAEVLVENNVLILDVSMNDVKTVQVCHPSHYLQC